MAGARDASPFTHRNLPRLLLQAREAVMAHTRPSLRRHALSDQQWRVLRVLGEHGTVDTGRVAREAFILGPSLTGVLARMERDGLIERARDPQDQRRTEVKATARGRALVRKLSTTIEDHYGRLERAMGKDKLASLYALLDDLIAMEQPPNAARPPEGVRHRSAERGGASDPPARPPEGVRHRSAERGGASDPPARPPEGVRPRSAPGRDAPGRPARARATGRRQGLAA